MTNRREEATPPAATGGVNGGDGRALDGTAGREMKDSAAASVRELPDEVDPGAWYDYANCELTLIPLHHWSMRSRDGKELGKAPRDAGWTRRDYDRDEVLGEALLTKRNLGVRLPDGVVVLDWDPRNADGKQSLDALRLLYDDGAFDRCPRVLTGSGGEHLYFRKPEGTRIVQGLPDFPGIDFKTAGGQVVSAGSVHPNGRLYRWAPGSPLPSEMPQLPADLLALITRRPPERRSDGRGDMSCAGAKATLGTINPEDFREHGTWLQLLMGFHHATDGAALQEFSEWSTGDPKYAGAGPEIERRWNSLSADGSNGSPITIRTLYSMVEGAGGTVIERLPEEDFDEAPEEPSDTRPKPKPKPKALTEADVIRRLNEKHFAILGGKFRVATEGRDARGRHALTYSSDTDLRARYRNARVEVGGGKTRTYAEVWLGHEERREYEGVEFAPEGGREGYYNLWKGWGVEEKEGDWSLMQELILDVLADGVEAHRDYILDWLAYMIQRPGVPAGVALCFRGEKGTGKGTLGRAVCAIAGTHSLHISSPELLIGRFNSHLQNCLFLFADEAFWAGDKAGESKLKQLITEPEIAYEAKGRNAAMGPNLIHVMMASNSEWMAPAGVDGERRYAVFEVSNRRMGDHAFFDALNRQLEEGGLSGMLHDLKRRRLRPGWAPHKSIPQTQALADQKELSMGSGDLWWQDLVERGVLPPLYSDEKRWVGRRPRIAAAVLCDDYRQYAKERGERRPLSDAQVKAVIRKYTSERTKQARVEEPGVFEPNGTKTIKKVKAYIYDLPSLEECRGRLQQMRGGEPGWIP